VPQRSCLALAWVLLLGGLASPPGAPLRSQTAPPGDNEGRVFKANARIVILDVVVTGKGRRPLTGLHQQDFLVSEDGHPQAVNYFEEHTGAQPLQVSPPDLPPNLFTNIPRVKPSGSVTVLVLDSLNTPLDDQRQVHAQVLKYLKKPQTGQKMAIFTLGTQLRLIQSFTDDPALLSAAINNKKNGVGKQISPLLQSNAETAAAQETAAAMREAHGEETAEALEQFMANQSSTRSDARLKLTLEALQELAHYLAGFPGRKNVVWFSGAFPVVIFPDPDARDSFGAQRDDQEEVRKTDALLTAAQVAIYPIGAEGLATDSPYSAGADARLVTQSQLSRPQGQVQERNANHAAMELIAKDTGGAAFYNTNGLANALERVADHGSNFYTLTYTSTNPATDGKFRKIQVALVRPGYQLDYRRGYYADDAKTTPAAVPAPAPTPNPAPNYDLLSPFLRPGAPDSTQIPLTLRVVRKTTPPRAGPASTTHSTQGGDNLGLKGALTRYAVDLMMPAHGLQFDLAPDGHRHVRIEAGLLVYNREGKLLNWLLRQVNLNLDDARYAIVQANGVNLYFEIDAPGDGVSLRGGVYDLNANLAGTLEVPLSTIVSPIVSAPLTGH
jgi:VWFA-related protein